MSPIYGCALAGMQVASTMACQSASNVAQGVSSPGGPDLVGDVVQLSSARVQMAASVAVVRTAQQMQRSLLDMMI